MDRLAALLDFYRDDPEDAFTRFALATEYLKRGDVGQARTFFEDLVRDHPDYVGTYYHLAKLYERLELTDDAIRTYEQGLDAAKRNGDFHARAELQSALLEAKGFGFDE